ncbi:MAG: glycosyltransferase family 25 protein [Rouxiella badensis]|uniref:glycosyltransferase family 25 protein n=1 Tax=Rouxiella badensis TaxID=1646377 RepID=UPI003C51DB2C
MKLMKAFVISLKKDLEKRTALLMQCQNIGLETEVFYAVDGATLSEEFISRSVDNYFSMGANCER